MQNHEVNLHNTEDSSDKVYNIFVTQNGTGLWDVTATYGRRTAVNLQSTVIASNVSYPVAMDHFRRKSSEKKRKGYVDITRPNNQTIRPAVVIKETKVYGSSSQTGSSTNKQWNGEEERKIFL